MKLTPEQLKTIDATIKSVAKAQADRFFKLERNTFEYAVLVYSAIKAEIDVALLLAGVPFENILRDIYLVDVINGAMVERGYVGIEIYDEEDLLGPDADQGYEEVFGPVVQGDCSC